MAQLIDRDAAIAALNNLAVFSENEGLAQNAKAIEVISAATKAIAALAALKGGA